MWDGKNIRVNTLNKRSFGKDRGQGLTKFDLKLIIKL
jgi:hypothetical protein